MALPPLMYTLIFDAVSAVVVKLEPAWLMIVADETDNQISA